MIAWAYFTEHHVYLSYNHWFPSIKVLSMTYSLLLYNGFSAVAFAVSEQL